MRIAIPDKIFDGIDNILIYLKECRRIKNYRFFIGDTTGASDISFDDSGWYQYVEPVKLKKSQGTAWFRFDVKIPDMVMGIPVSGSKIRLSSFFMAPVDVYINGVLMFSERTWMDFKVPEITFVESAIPGQVFKIAVKAGMDKSCFHDWQFTMDYIIENVENVEFEIKSFKEELKYACRFNEAEAVLPDICTLIFEALKNSGDLPDFIGRVRVSREMLKPVEGEAKKRTVHMVGHAHIDMNWFWSMEETLDIIKRDFETITRIMEDTPDFKFSQSQCVTYEIAEMNYPEIFKRISEFIKSGNWEVTASTWVEGDMNMVSGESIVRHILYSKKFIKDRFNIEPRIMWCPDTFGHSANIPQIAKKGGIDYYFMIRCGRGNPVFWWEGLDGSRLLVFNVTYYSSINPTDIFDIAGQLEESYGLGNSMYVYGVGDHGGGPTRRDIKRLKQLDAYPSTPRLKFSRAQDFFDCVINDNSVKIPVEKGELNYVFDGCYTTHSDIKKYNRLCENMLIRTEILCMLGRLCGLKDKGEVIEKCWKAALFNQFHDIFDGCGIKATYDYSTKLAEETLNLLLGVSGKIIKDLCSRIKASKSGFPYAIFNTTGWKRSECIKIEKSALKPDIYIATDEDGNDLPVQESIDDTFVFVKDIPSIGYKVIYLNKGGIRPDFNGIKKGDEYYEIETKYYLLEINKNSGEITTFYDRVNNKYVVRRDEIGYRLRNGILNTLQVHYEMPTPMSSWTIGTVSSIRNLVSGAKSSIKEDGPIIKVLNFEHRFGDSLISQDIVVYNDNPRIDFVTHVEWNEYGSSEKEAPMLKACFIPDINNRFAVCEIPFGTVERPCKDVEVPALKWVDIYDESYGMALLNNCKYGYKVKGNVMELTLIRSGWEPDPASDIGNHDFIYSIIPHKGNWMDNQIIKEGYCLNNSLMAFPIIDNSSFELPGKLSLVEIDNPNVAISAFKPAEYEDEYILRVYEGAGVTSDVRIKLGFNADKIFEVDLNEKKLYGLVNLEGTEFEFKINSYEIKTFKVFSNSLILHRKVDE